MSHPPFSQIELLAPAGDMCCARAAVENGADAVYFGLDRGFNARARATNISMATLPELMQLLHGRGVRGYLTLNTLVFSDELEAFEETVRGVAAAGVDAVLIQDIGVASLIRSICPDLALHASTQMTMTSAECISVAQALAVERVVLARELSVDEIRDIHQHSTMPLEAFAHGALCVAYSGQCMTSESLGGRSANRGQCAQACRLPYELICDGKEVDLGDMQYLLSPQDLAAHALIPEMLDAGVRCFKIEGRLKTPDYVANITQKYRVALDTAISSANANQENANADVARSETPPLSERDIEEMELSFSRGFSPGWLQGCDHKMLVPALSSAKRGVLLGEVMSVRRSGVVVRLTSSVQPGDGIAFTDGDASRDGSQGGRVYEVASSGGVNEVELRLAHGKVDFNLLEPGMQVWKTDDPQLSRRLRRTYDTPSPQYRLALDYKVTAEVGMPLSLTGFVYRTSGSSAQCLATAQVSSKTPLEAARKHPLSIPVLRDQLGRLGATRFELRNLRATISGANNQSPMAPLSMLNQLRQQLTAQLETILDQPIARPVATELVLPRLRREIMQINSNDATSDSHSALNERSNNLELRVLCRSVHQLNALAEAPTVGGIRPTAIVEFQDIRQYREAAAIARQANLTWWLATPRIQKPGEMGIFHSLLRHTPDGFLIRNLAGLDYFQKQGARVAGDFSLNAANELTVAWLIQRGLESVTISYDLNREQLSALLQYCPTPWLEAVVHQHMPMFHMEHCVFCSVLSPGTDKTNCGRPCDFHQVGMRDRVGKVHRLHADVGCRNTLYNATAQSAAEAAPQLLRQGVRRFRVELLDDAPYAEIHETIRLYSELLAGRLTGQEVWTRLRADNRVGVTRGTMEAKRNPLAIL